MSTDKIFRVLVLKEEDMFVAQGLEHDVCVQAADMTTLKKRFESALAMEDDVLAIGPAPQNFHDLWDAAFDLDGQIDNTQMRLAA